MSSDSITPRGGLELAADCLLAGNLDQARSICSGIMRIDPTAPEASHLFGLTLARSGDFTEAAETLVKAIQMDPDRGSWYCDLGTVYAAVGDSVQAVNYFRKAFELIPGDIQNLLSYSRALYAAKMFEECSKAARLLLERIPNDPEPSKLLASALWQLGDVTGALGILRQLSVAGLSDAATESFRLGAVLHELSQTPELIVGNHRAWGEKFCAPTRPVDRYSFPNSREIDRPLRVGYLTGEFHCCAGYHFVSPLVRGHEGKNCEIFCYDTRDRMDGCGRSIRNFGHHWHEVHDLSDDGLGRLIQSHRIDVLVELSGQFFGNRLPALANRLAPVQVFYPNYPATSGLANIDYVLTDGWVCPPGLERNYSEQVYRIPSGYLVYAPPGKMDITELPALSNRRVTFGLFQRPQKLNSSSWDAIAGVLRAVPNSRLLVQYDSALRSRFTAELETRGVAGARVDFKDWLPMRERVSLLSEVDIALDTFPYNGQTTTCECLWMGVPVVTRSGETHVSRVTASILHQVGLSDWIAESTEEYVAIATRRANTLDDLAVLRAGLRQRLAASTLLDAKGKALEFEHAYREMWRAWVQTARSVEAPSSEMPFAEAPSGEAPTLNAA